jgi:hypothetical protein
MGFIRMIRQLKVIQLLFDSRSLTGGGRQMMYWHSWKMSNPILMPRSAKAGYSTAFSAKNSDFMGAVSAN